MFALTVPLSFLLLLLSVSNEGLKHTPKDTVRLPEEDNTLPVLGLW